jgi:hypothetical protein
MIVCSGGGVHFYYLLDTPWANFPVNGAVKGKYSKRYKEMRTFKQLLTKKFQAVGIGKVDMISVTQSHRLPGSHTKKGLNVLSFKTGKRYTIGELADLCGGEKPQTEAEFLAQKEVKEKSKTRTLKQSKTAVKEPKQKAHKVYDNALDYMPNGRRGFWTSTIDLFLRNRPKPGQRELALFGLAIVGKKSRIKREEVEREIRLIIGILNNSTPNTR